MKSRVLACLVDAALFSAGGALLWAVMWGESRSRAVVYGITVFALWFGSDLWRSRDETKPPLGRLIVRFASRWR